MRFACCVPKATNKRSEFLIFLLCLQQLLLHKRTWIVHYKYIDILGLVRFRVRLKYKIFWTAIYRTLPAFIQLCFVNGNLTFCSGTEYLKFWFNLEQVLFRNTLRLTKYLWNCDFILAPPKNCKRYDVLWWNFTGDILLDKRTSKRSMPMSPPSSHWWWPHRNRMLSLSALQPEIKLCIITEQKCVERLDAFQIFIRLVIRNTQVVLQISSTEKDTY